MAKYFSSLLSKEAEAFRHESADQAKQHNIILVKITPKAASIGENVLEEKVFLPERGPADERRLELTVSGASEGGINEQVDGVASSWMSKAAMATKNLSSELRQGESNMVSKVVSQYRSDLMKPQLMLTPAYDGKRTQTTNLGLLASY